MVADTAPIPLCRLSRVTESFMEILFRSFDRLEAGESRLLLLF
jgi:hypothetical protein